MARQAGSERSIPHLRDIFSLGAWDSVGVGDASSRKKQKQQQRRDSGSDVKHLERHLSMKKTIRKKMMRDLQQAFVEDPNEFRVEDISPEQLKAEIKVDSLSFGGPQKTTTATEATFLDMLRGGAPPATTHHHHHHDDDDDDRDSGHSSDADNNYPPPTPQQQQQQQENNNKASFWRRFTIKGRNKR